MSCNLYQPGGTLKNIEWKVQQKKFIDRFEQGTIITDTDNPWSFADQHANFDGQTNILPMAYAKVGGSRASPHFLFQQAPDAS